MPIHARTYAGLFLVSLAALMCEIALTRLFSFSLWYHFAYMTISVALLGYGAAGSFYFAFPGIVGKGPERALGSWALAGGAFVVVCLLIVASVPFDPARLFPAAKFDWRADPKQFLYLAAFYPAVTAPFFATGLCVTILLRAQPARIPQLYFADLVGAAFGCAAAVLLLTPLGAPGVIGLSAALFGLAALLFAWGSPTRWVALAGFVVLLVVGPFLLAGLEIRPSATKLLARMTQNENTEIVFTRWNPVYRVDIYGGKNAPLRLGRHTAWGVSQRFEGEGPENLVINHDGDASTVMYRSDGDLDSLRILDHSILRLPYLALDRPEVLVIGAGGGVDVLVALKNQARHVTAVELNPVTVDVVTNHYADYIGNLFGRPDVTAVVDEGRNYIRRSDQKYDLVQITGIDTVAAVYSGAYVLSESYLYTVDAMTEYLRHLEDDGIVSIVRGDWMVRDTPPRQVLRLVSVAIAGLERLGVEQPSRHLAVLMAAPRGFGTPIFSLLVRRAPFATDQIDRIRAHAQQEGFEPWYLPGSRIRNPVANLIEMSPKERENVYQEYWLDLSPPTDDKPFFFNFLRWRSLLEATQVRADYTFASGQLVLGAVLLQSLLFAALLIVAPLLRVGRRVRGAGLGRFLIYFACIGVGFIFIEISYIQRFTLFLGSPVFSLSVILASLLFFSGVGSHLSGRLRWLADTRSALLRLAAALCVLNFFYVLALPSIFSAVLGNALLVRIACAIALLAPAGLVMGAFLPVGMRVVEARSPDAIPWAWAANGVASVVGAILCIAVAMGVGFGLVNLIALAVYAIGVGSLWGLAARATSQG